MLASSQAARNDFKTALAQYLSGVSAPAAAIEAAPEPVGAVDKRMLKTPHWRFEGE